MATYQRTYYQDKNEVRRVGQQDAARRDESVRRGYDLNGLRADRQKLIDAGVDASHLPVLHDGMSEEDFAAAAHALSNASTGNAGNAHRSPGSVFDNLPAHGSPAPSPGQLPQPVGDQHSLLGNPIPPPTMAGSTPAQIAAFNANTATSVSDVNTKAAAGTGKVVQTPYGTASSTMATKGSTPTDAVTSNDGVKRLTWQEQVVKNHPEIGQEGTQANKAFVEAYKRAQANPGADTEADPIKLAANVMASIRKPADPTAGGLATPGGNIASPIAANPAAGFKGGTDIGAPLAPVAWNGFDVADASNDYKPIETPPNLAQDVGQSLTQGAAGAAKSVDDWLDRNVVAPVMNYGVNPVVDFAKGVFHPNGGTVAAKPYVPASTLPPPPAGVDTSYKLPPFAGFSTPTNANPSFSIGTGVGSPPPATSTPPASTATTPPPGVGGTPLSFNDVMGGANSGPKTPLDQFAQNPAQDAFKKKLTRPDYPDQLVS